MFGRLLQIPNGIIGDDRAIPDPVRQFRRIAIYVVTLGVAFFGCMVMLLAFLWAASTIAFHR